MKRWADGHALRKKLSLADLVFKRRQALLGWLAEHRCPLAGARWDARAVQDWLSDSRHPGGRGVRCGGSEDLLWVGCWWETG